MILYNLRTEGPSLRITKFDADLNVESTYLVSTSACECPQGHRATCRHRRMLGAMQAICDTEAFYCYETLSYHSATGQPWRLPAPDQPLRRRV